MPLGDISKKESSGVPHPNLMNPLYIACWLESALGYLEWSAGWCKLEKKLFSTEYDIIAINLSILHEQYIRLTLITSTVIEICTHTWLSQNKRVKVFIIYPHFSLPDFFGVQNCCKCNCRKIYQYVFIIQVITPFIFNIY